MNTIHPQYIADKDGKKTAVVLPMDEFEQLLEELKDIKLFNEAKKDKEPAMLHDDYVKQRFSK